MQKKLQYTFLVAILFSILATVSCQVERISQSQLELERLSVTITDLPDGWVYSGQNWNESFGGETYTIGYGVPYNNIIRFAHTITEYSNEDQAKIGYPKWEADTFDGDWNEWEGANFVPSDPNDQYRFECLQVLSDTSVVSCRYLQRHNQIISYVLVNLDGEAMTLSQLNEILGVLDVRLNEVVVKK